MKRRLKEFNGTIIITRFDVIISCNKIILKQVVNCKGEKRTSWQQKCEHMFYT